MTTVNMVLDWQSLETAVCVMINHRIRRCVMINHCIPCKETACCVAGNFWNMKRSEAAHTCIFRCFEASNWIAGWQRVKVDLIEHDARTDGKKY